MQISPNDKWSLAFALFGEFAGSFAIALIGCCGAILSNSSALLYASLIGGLFSGVTLTFCIYTLTKISGAHVNPAITIAFYLLNKIRAKRVPFYIAAQFMGSILAGFILFSLIGSDARLGLNAPDANIDVSHAFAVEIYVSSMMMLVILFPFSKRIEFAKPALIGTIVMVNIWLFGSEFGAAMNPIRAFGPNIFFPSYWPFIWIYLLGPMMGCLAITLLFRCYKGREKER